MFFPICSVLIGAERQILAQIGPGPRIRNYVRSNSDYIYEILNFIGIVLCQRSSKFITVTRVTKDIGLNVFGLKMCLIDEYNTQNSDYT